MNDPFEFWEASMQARKEAITRVGKDLGEKPREVDGTPLDEDDADLFARLLGIDLD